MENKLSVINETDWHCNYRVINERNNTKAIFVNEKDAQEYCDLKNKKKISKQSKQIVLSCLESILKFGISPNDYNIEDLKNGIEIIKSWEAEK